jgi:DNA replication and repair protein RecF
VRLVRLTLRNFRNYRRLEFSPERGISVFAGANAQGKTNLLEAVYLLATTRAARGNDADLIRQGAAEDGPPAAFVAGRAEGRHGEVSVEVAVAAREGAPAATTPPGGVERANKRLRVNGVPRRASEVIGQITAVLFTANDIDVITGAPALRRRYLDITIAQTDTSYIRAQQRYSRALLQRNSLLRRIDEGRAPAEELAYWDGEIVREGARIVRARALTVATLSLAARDYARRLSDDRELLDVTYAPQTPLPAGELPAEEAIETVLRSALAATRRREIALGQTLIGPHRDDLRFALDGAPVAAFGSRAQQRTAALALRLAEAAYLAGANADPPILLLDDIFSELDAERRRAVLALLPEAQQVFITTAERDEAATAAAAGAHVYEVQAGTLTPRADGGEAHSASQ